MPQLFPWILVRLVAECGIAFLKGKHNSEVIRALIEISGGEFQKDLVNWGKKNKKNSANYEVPLHASLNTPYKVNNFSMKHRTRHLFPERHFGSEFDPVEFKLIKCFSVVKEKSKISLLKIFVSGVGISKNTYKVELERLGLFHSKSFTDVLLRCFVAGTLAEGEKDLA